MSGREAQLPLNWQGLDPVPPLKRAMAAALRECDLSREQVADRMNQLLAADGQTPQVTINTIEKWVAPSAIHVIPLRLLPVFCRVVDSLLPLEALAAPLGAKLAGPLEQALIRWAQAQEDKRRAAIAERRAREALEEMR